MTREKGPPRPPSPNEPDDPVAWAEAWFREKTDGWLALAYHHTRDWGWAEDAVQDAVAEWLEAVREGQAPAARDAWMRTVVARRAIDRVRREASVRRNDSRRAPVPMPVDPEEAVAADLFHEDRLPQALAALASLPERQRHATSRRWLHGHSYARIAREMACEESTIRSLVRHGVTRLREILLSAPPEPDAT